MNQRSTRHHGESEGLSEDGWPTQTQEIQSTRQVVVQIEQLYAEKIDDDRDIYTDIGEKISS